MGLIITIRQNYYYKTMTKDKYKLIRNVCLCLGAIIFIGLMIWSFFGNMELFEADKHYGYDSYLQWYLKSRFAYELAFAFVASMIPVGVAAIVNFTCAKKR